MSSVSCGSGASAAPGGGSMSREAERSRGRALWDRWPWPFVWILAVPLLTVWPTSDYLDIHLSQHGPCIRTSALVACPAPLVLLGLAPGLLNLLPALWLLASGRRERTAAAMATILGAIRVVVPAMLYLTRGPYVDMGGRDGHWGAEFWIGLVSILLWFGSLQVFLLFGLVSWITDRQHWRGQSSR